MSSVVCCSIFSGVNLLRAQSPTIPVAFTMTCTLLDDFPDTHNSDADAAKFLKDEVRNELRIVLDRTTQEPALRKNASDNISNGDVERGDYEKLTWETRQCDRCLAVLSKTKYQGQPVAYNKSDLCQTRVSTET